LLYMKFYISVLLSVFYCGLYAQATNPANDAEAAALLQKVSEKYKAYKNISASFKLIVQRPRLKPEEDDKKYTDTIPGQILLAGPKFKIALKEQEIYCDGKTIWTYILSEKETQVNTFEETDDMFSPTQIFTLFKDGYLYQIKEKKVVNGHNLTVIEMAPPNKKLSYFKIDVTIDEASLQFVESKIYEKNGVRYVYKITKQAPNTAISDDNFVFDAKKHPGVKLIDLR
jgi:outer membrane lipoprotein carrier protein